ncbi:S-adenosylmethionine synthase 5-like [Pyrus ussuriensis x Pyrus communis]|uniref:S-adenosylmethionine synthase 5-like n=1 Tax=Pyrus ussuriensis x Pyrus communis TaxID=2448454 RepID=A0A5N5H4X2_9ROSA|nr:S-adenosylmethionine synthase 5-like [Pyrus ussuriensis x Pyrus communis]
MDTLGDIRALLLNVNQDLAVVSIKTNTFRNKSNCTAGIAHNLFVVHFGFGCNLSEDHDHVRLGARLAGNFAHCIRNLITELIGVPLVHGLGSKQEGVC